MSLIYSVSLRASALGNYCLNVEGRRVIKRKGDVTRRRGPTGRSNRVYLLSSIGVRMRMEYRDLVWPGNAISVFAERLGPVTYLRPLTRLMATLDRSP